MIFNFELKPALRNEHSCRDPHIFRAGVAFNLTRIGLHRKLSISPMLRIQSGWKRNKTIELLRKPIWISSITELFPWGWTSILALKMCHHSFHYRSLIFVADRDGIHYQLLAIESACGFFLCYTAISTVVWLWPVQTSETKAFWWDDFWWNRGHEKNRMKQNGTIISTRSRCSASDLFKHYSLILTLWAIQKRDYYDE
jgi:hypothetical protein